MRNRYFVGLGSNIDPARNMAAMLERLVETFGAVTVSRIVETAPYRMATAARFLNAVATFKSDRAPADLKRTFVAWEIALGRDRSHPESKRRDRPADLDILLVVDGDRAATPLPADEPYLTPLLRELAARVGVVLPPPDGAATPVPLRPVGVTLFGVSVGESPSAIDHDGGAGHVRVLED